MNHEKVVNQALAHGHFEISVNNGPWEIEPNIVVTEGLNYILSAALGAATQKTTFHLGLFGGNVTPLNTWTGANVTANSTEFINYNEASRQIWTEDAVAAGIIGNNTTPAVFTMSSGGGTVRGAFLAEASAKSATTGVLIAAARFGADKTFTVGEELRLKYIITGSST